MYAITGATGHVGGAAARALLAQRQPVRAVVRDPARGAAWSQHGTEVAIAGFGDRSALADALRGCRGAFILLPTDPTATDLDADHRHLADAIADAVRASGVPHVAMLSSIGADLADGTGPVRWLHHLESRLQETGVLLTAIRPCHFQENVAAVLGAAVEAEVYPVFGDSADVPIPRIATRDVGAVVAESLRSPSPASEVIDLDGPRYTERAVAGELAAVLGKPLQVVTIPQPGWIGALVDAGVPAPFAAELAELYAAEQRDALTPSGDRQQTCVTGLDETLRQLVPAPA